MGDYNPHLPYILGNEWVPIQEPVVKLQRNVNNVELGVGFQLDGTAQVTDVQIYTGQEKNTEATVYNQVNLYPFGKEALSGPIRKVVIPVQSVSVTGTNWDTTDDLNGSFCQNGSVISGPGCNLVNSLSGYGNVTFRYNGNPTNLIQRMAMSFAVNDFELFLSDKRILNASLLHRGTASARAADSAGNNNIVVPLQRLPGTITPTTAIRVVNTPGGSSTLSFQGPTLENYTGILGTGSLTLANEYPNPTTNRVVPTTNALNLGDVTTLWTFPNPDSLSRLPWNFDVLSQFDDRSSNRRWIEFVAQIPQVYDGGAVSGTGRVVLNYFAIEVTYCEENRIAVGGRRIEPVSHEVTTQTDSTLHTMPLHPVFNYGTSPVSIDAGIYTLAVSSVHPGEITTAPVDVEYPRISATRPLNPLPSHPIKQIKIPFPFDDTVVGKTFTEEPGTAGVQLSLLSDGDVILPQTHVYGEQDPAPVYGDFVLRNYIVDAPSTSVEWPWIRFWARRFGNTAVPLTVTCNGSTASISATEFDALDKLTTENWREITLALEPSLVISPPVSGSPDPIEVTWTATGELAGNRWEVLGSTAASVSGYVQNQIPLYFSMSPATYGAGINSSWGLVIPGASGDFASTPDTAALDITGDIDIRAEITPDNWTPAINQYVVTKYYVTGNQRSYGLRLNATGTLQFFWSETGANELFETSDVSVPFSGGKRGAIRATLDVNNGASNYTLRFWVGPCIEGPWTQLGGDESGSGTTSIFAGTAPLEVSGRDGGTSQPFAGTVHAVQVYDGIDGTLVADVHFQEQVPGDTSFVDDTGLTWTINGDSYIGSLAFEGAPVTLLDKYPDAAVFLSQEVPPVTGFTLTPATQTLTGIGMDCGDTPCCVPSELYYQRLTWDLPEGTNYAFQDIFDRTEADGWGLPGIYTVPPSGLWLPGTTGSYASTPDDAALDITGDIDIRVRASLENWGNGVTEQDLLSKWLTTGNQRSYRMFVETDGSLVFARSPDGIITGGTAEFSSSITLPSAVKGELSVRAVFDADNGAGGSTVTFYTSTDIDLSTAVWTQLGAPVTKAGTSTIFSGTAQMEVGSFGNGLGGLLTGTVHAVQVRNGIAGTIVANPDFIAEPANTTSFVDSAGRTWTVNGSASINSSDAFSVVDEHGYVNSNLGPGSIVIEDIGYNYDLSVILRQEQEAAATASVIGRDRYVFEVVTTGTSTTAYELWLKLGSTGSFLRIRDIDVTGGPFTQGIYSSVYVRYLLDGTKWKVKAWPEVVDQPDIWAAEVDVSEFNGLALPTPLSSGNFASTPDTASLDITGDLDVRCEVTTNWNVPSAGYIVAKYAAEGGDQRSWGFRTDTGNTGFLEVVFSTTGANAFTHASTVPVPAENGSRLAVRFTLDADDGSGNRIVTFYIAPSIDGPWTQLGDTVTSTSITLFSSTADVTVGSRDLGNQPIEGVVHAVEIRDGINGTIVANPIFENQSDGTTSFADSTGKTWTVNGFAYILNDEAVATNSDIELKISDSGYVSYQNLVVTPPQYWFGNYEIQRRDEVETEWKTILQATNPALTGFNDYEARPGIISDYRIRRVNIYNFPSEWSPVVTGMIPAPGVVTNDCIDGGHLLLFTSNERQDGSINLAYSTAWLDSQVEEGFTFPETDFVQMQAMYDRNFYVAFRPLERGGEQFSRTVLVQAAAISPETLADFTSLRDMAWDTVNYICVRDEDGNRWLANIQVPNGNVLRNRRLYLAPVNITEVTDTPTPVDPDPWS